MPVIGRASLSARVRQSNGTVTAVPQGGSTPSSIAHSIGFGASPGLAVPSIRCHTMRSFDNG